MSYLEVRDRVIVGVRKNSTQKMAGLQPPGLLEMDASAMKGQGPR